MEMEKTHIFNIYIYMYNTLVNVVVFSVLYTWIVLDWKRESHNLILRTKHLSYRERNHLFLILVVLNIYI